MGYRLGVDTGGSFTDLTLIDEESGEIRLHKLSSTPDDPSRAVIAGIRELLSDAAISPSRITYLGHGTTVAINAVLMGRMPRTGLITTAGFRDLLELGRQRRPSVWDLDVKKPVPIAPRSLRWEVDERLAADGSVVRSLDPDEVRRVALQVKASGVEAVAVCLLHSYVEPRHERLVGEILREICPDCAVSLSVDVLPEFREYERCSTTTMNAALKPVISGYLERLQRRADSLGFSTVPRVMKSNGDTMGIDASLERPIDLLFSGPSAGVTGAVYVAQCASLRDVITFDMGGTSTDVCLVEDGRLRVTNEQTVRGLPVKTAAVDVRSVGAGGGSVAWVDAGGFLRVGPQSAGAHPGPACYGLGGDQPTVTDANVVLGRLNPTELLGGRMKIDRSLAIRAVTKGVADLLGIDVRIAARGIIGVLISGVVAAVRLISVERGSDPRDTTLVAFGGAGPMHAGALARELGMRRVLVPQSPGVLCALGLLVADLGTNYNRTLLTRCDDPDLPKIATSYSAMEAQARSWLRREGVPSRDHLLTRSADMRYIGQEHWLAIPVPGGDLTDARVSKLVASFHESHERIHGYCSRGALVEIVGVRLRARAVVRKPAVKSEGSSGSTAVSDTLIGTRQVDFGDEHLIECPVYQRNRLRPGGVIRGPAILEQMDTTTVVFVGQRAEVDGYLNLLIHDENA